MSPDSFNSFNVKDTLKNLSVEEIAQYCRNNTIDASVCMINVEGDFNLSTLVRNANFFGFSSVHYAGKKKWDKRGAVGTYNYTPLYYYETEEVLINSQQHRTIVAIENNIPKYSHKTEDLYGADFKNLISPLFVFGSENHGLSDYVLGACDKIYTIKDWGSVRSLNVGTVSGIIMSEYRKYIETKNSGAKSYEP
jgi:tRNA G18 (ribose-2'-O)-methylase SpoU